MTSTVFMDYTGTMVREDEPYTQRLVSLYAEHCEVHDPQILLTKVWGMIRQIEWEYCGEHFVKKDELVDMVLRASQRELGLNYDLEELHEIWRNSWVHAPLFEDVKPFFEQCSLPIYVVTNDDLIYVEESMQEKGLRPKGIISAEMVRACKPHPEILTEGLRIAGVRAEETVMIGDSENSDVACAMAAGVQPILPDRKRKAARADIPVVHSLPEALKYLI